jgi:hypothetical protein
MMEGDMMHNPDFLKAAKDRAFEVIISNLPAVGTMAVVAVMILTFMVVLGNSAPVEVATSGGWR